VLVVAEPIASIPRIRSGKSAHRGTQQRTARLPSQAIEATSGIPLLTVTTRSQRTARRNGKKPGVYRAPSNSLKPRLPIAPRHQRRGEDRQSRPPPRENSANVLGLIEGSDPALAA